jgi:cytochrome c oxidase subunit 3
MTNIQRTDYQTHPYHLVDQSPWPLLTSLALLGLVVAAVLYMHGFVGGGLLLTLGFVLTAFAMTLWFRDIIAEGTLKM